jgi:hypothetical protein
MAEEEKVFKQEPKRRSGFLLNRTRMWEIDTLKT